MTAWVECGGITAMNDHHPGWISPDPWTQHLFRGDLQVARSTDDEVIRSVDSGAGGGIPGCSPSFGDAIHSLHHEDLVDQV
jgi:hypothetical protein